MVFAAADDVDGGDRPTAPAVGVFATGCCRTVHSRSTCSSRVRSSSEMPCISIDAMASWRKCANAAGKDGPPPADAAAIVGMAGACAAGVAGTGCSSKASKAESSIFVTIVLAGVARRLVVGSRLLGKRDVGRCSELTTRPAPYVCTTRVTAVPPSPPKGCKGEGIKHVPLGQGVGSWR